MTNFNRVELPAIPGTQPSPFEVLRRVIGDYDDSANVSGLFKSAMTKRDSNP